MLKVLLVKTSSLGDIVHTLPALTDAAQAIPAIRFDWVVEEAFEEMPTWHPQVQRVIPIAWRKWRSTLHSPATWRALKQARQQLQQQSYDLILDAQGLLKSALFACLARGKRAGLDYRSAREYLAACFYQQRYPVHPLQQATTRMRLLFSQALKYPVPTTPPECGILSCLQQTQYGSALPYVVFLHGTAWETKQWPEAYWRQLCRLVTQAGWAVKMLTWHVAEKACAMRIAQSVAPQGSIEILTELKLTTAARLLVAAQAVVTVDTGLGHLAAALGTPTLSLYGPTNPAYTGAIGKQSQHLSVHFPCAPCLQRTCRYAKPLSNGIIPPCFATLPPTKVWEALKRLLQH